MRDEHVEEHRKHVPYQQISAEATRPTCEVS